MQVYKLFLKILKAQWGQVVVYLGIFLGIMAIMQTQHSDKPDAQYVDYKLELAISDQDQTAESKAFVSYLQENSRKRTIPDFNKETIQDELFFRNIDAAIIIPKGFAANLAKGNAEACVDTYTLPGLMTANLTKNRINQYLATAITYAEKGHTLMEGMDYAKKSASIHGTVTYMEKKSDGRTSRYIFFSYLAYVLLCITFVSGLAILKVFHTKTLDDRIQCSSYPFNRKNLEIFLGMVTLGALTYVAFAALGFFYFKTDIFTKSGGLLLLNAAGYMIMVLALTYFLGQLVDKETLISPISNIVGLGFSFLGGVFVPIEYLGKTVLKIAHFLPSYWYVLGCDFADHYTGGSILPGLHYLGIELVFALVFYLAGITALKLRENR
ncbi:ABC-2 type transport system permease protein [Lachnospiraceae bacterium XBB1006]|nr:ABC-2 type transport system permease protein [Lachnospiraceae bacterium XBB1006]